MDTPNVWEEILARIETKINRHSFHTWFRPTSFISEAGQTLRVRVPNPVFRDWLTKHYSNVLNEALGEIERPLLTIEFVTEPQPDAPTTAEAAPKLAPVEEEVLAADADVDFESAQEPESSYAGLAYEASPAVGLNPRYLFETFVVGPSNQFAEAACRAVA